MITNRFLLFFFAFSLNPVAHSFMVKLLTSVCEAESVNADFAMLDSIAATSNGDARSAVNLLQYKLGYSKRKGLIEILKRLAFALKTISVCNDHFLGLSGFKRPPCKRPRNVKANTVDKEDVFVKDESLFLFHALGKVLNSKSKL